MDSGRGARQKWDDSVLTSMLAQGKESKSKERCCPRFTTCCISAHFHMLFGLPSDFEDIIFSGSNNNKKKAPDDGGKVTCALMSSAWVTVPCSGCVWWTQESQEVVLSRVRISVHPFTLMGSKSTPFLPHLKWISLKLWGQKEKMSYQHTTVFDSFSICICISINFKSETIKQTSFSFQFASAVTGPLSDVYSSQSHHSGWF